MRVIQIPKESVNQKWDEIKSWFSETERLTEQEFSIEQLKRFAETGQVILAVFQEDSGNIVGAFTIAFRDELNGRVAYLTMIGGRSVATKATFEEFKRFLRSFGANKIMGSASPAIARLWRRLGLTQKYVVVGSNI